jgi:predicted LPLAT superfamily acyltransferase
MPDGSGPGAAWAAAPERGSDWTVRLMIWIARRLGWGVAQLLLYPITAYFLVCSPRQRAVARIYLGRALGRPADMRDLYRLYFAFASTILERVWLVPGETAGFTLEIQGLEALRAIIAEGRGCLLFGAHFGSFEALRTVADAGSPVEVSVLMHEANARLKVIFDAMGGPNRASAVIPLGEPDSMLRVREALEAGGLVGLLADRLPRGERVRRVEFLGHPAPLPTGPHLLAEVLGAPVMLAFGIWRGPRRYEVRFEAFSPGDGPGPRSSREQAVSASVARYAARLEAMCREHPYNWFNFHDFWLEDGR